MNKQIEGLWWQARIGYNNQNCDPEVVAKFAQLIVRECADIALTDGQATGNFEVFNKITKHFGVEK